MDLMKLNIRVGVIDNATKKIAAITKGVGKIAGIAMGAAATGIAYMTKQAVAAYAQYEQLAGGAQKIFDQIDYARISADAQGAWETMNLSANQYLEMINSVGASFSATMGDEAGYETAKQGMQAIADYASGTGRSVDELSQKFGMITRSTSSYQSIADQFSGILPATSKDFLEQAQAAGFLSDSYKQLTQVPIAEYQQAVSRMLAKGVDDLNLTGNTAAETAHTITGSLAGLKASWENLLIGLGDSEADLDKLFSNLSKNAVNFAKNVQPVAKRALVGIGQLVKELAPTIGEELPGLMEDLLPDLIEASEGLIGGLADALPDVLDVLLDNAPDIISALARITKKLFVGVATAIPEILTSIWETIDETLTNSEFGERWSSIKESIVTAVDGIKEKWDELKDRCQPLIDKVTEAWDAFKKFDEEHHLIETAIEGIGKIIEGAILVVGDMATQINAVIDGLQWFIDNAAKAWNAFKDGAGPAADAVAASLSPILNILQALQGLMGGGLSGLFSGGGGSFSGLGGHFAIGNDYVPYNGYPAVLHRGEAVLTAREADAWRRGNGGGQVVQPVFNFNGVSQSDLDYIVGYVDRSLGGGSA